MYCKKCNKTWGRYTCPIKEGKHYCRECGDEVVASLELITCINAVEMPNDVIDYCIEKLDTSTHYQNDVVQVYNNNNVFAKWLKENGYKFKSNFDSEEFDHIGIIAT